MLAIVMLLINTIYAQHDHGDHVTAAFLEEESKRIAKLPWKNIIHEIGQTEIEIEKMKNKWRLDTEARAEGENGYYDLWNKHYGDIYRKFVDRFLILTHVCEELYDHNVECRHNDPWDDKYDGRGVQFRQEFVQEIHDAIEKHVLIIKEQREKHNDL